MLDGGEARAETLRVLELRVLDAVGLRPSLDVCARCGGVEELDRDGQVFDVRRGGVVCAACHGDGRALSGEARRALVDAQGRSLDESVELVLPPVVNASCRDALGALITDHLGRQLKSVEFIAKLNQAAS
jgi:recombinational DNA repair protein (RecF pathway)